MSDRPGSPWNLAATDARYAQHLRKSHAPSGPRCHISHKHKPWLRAQRGNERGHRRRRLAARRTTSLRICPRPTRRRPMRPTRQTAASLPPLPVSTAYGCQAPAVCPLLCQKSAHIAAIVAVIVAAAQSATAQLLELRPRKCRPCRLCRRPRARSHTESASQSGRLRGSCRAAAAPER
jgi:hypothetical protein